MKYLFVFLLAVFTSFPIVADPASYRPKIQFATDINPNDINKLDPRLLKVVNFIADYCEQNNITFVITSMIRSKERNKAVGSVSDTHTTGRAVDFSVKEKWGWTQAHIDVIFSEVEMRYNLMGAISYMGNRRTVFLMHDAGNGIHAHIQVDRNNPYKKVNK